MSSRARACAALLLGSLLVLAGATTASPAGAAAPRHCASQSRIDVPHAPMQQVDCLDDLTTAGTVATGHTDASDWAGLNAPGTRNPSGVPGLQVDGYFPDDSTSNTHHGWDHDSQFVIRLPDDWNGRLVVSGAPGTRTQFSGDFLFSDWLLARGYAYAMTDKGNNGGSFYARRRDARRRHRRVEPPRHPADPRREAGGRPALRPRAAADLPGRHLQRRLPRALAAGEPARAVRRWRRLGGHALPGGPPTCSPTCRSRCATTRRTRRPATRPRTGG